MTDYAPIMLRVQDENGSEIFSQIVPYEWEIDVKELMERAFILSQSPTIPDPFVYTLQYLAASIRSVNQLLCSFALNSELVTVPTKVLDEWAPSLAKL